MAYETDTMRPLHRLTPEGERLWREFLERKADEILYRHGHPVWYWLGRAAEFVRSFAAEDS